MSYDTTRPEDMPKFDDAFVDQVVAALRSGEHQQGRRWLHRVDNAGEHLYCCVGVMCEVAGLAAEPSDSPGCYRYETCNNSAPYALRRMARSDGDWTVLYFRNDGIDGRPQSFKQIAALIDRHGRAGGGDE